MAAKKASFFIYWHVTCYSLPAGNMQERSSPLCQGMGTFFSFSCPRAEVGVGKGAEVGVGKGAEVGVGKGAELSKKTLSLSLPN